MKYVKNYCTNMVFEVNSNSKAQAWMKGLKGVSGFVWRGTDDNMRPEQFVKYLNTYPYHYWTAVHEFVVDSCENLILYVDSELRDELTADGERNFNSLFGDRILHVESFDYTDYEGGEHEFVNWHDAFYTVE